MNVVLLLVLAVPAIIIATALYAVVAELRHNRIRRRRWDLPGDGERVLERLGSGD